MCRVELAVTSTMALAKTKKNMEVNNVNVWTLEYVLQLLFVDGVKNTNNVCGR